MSTVADTIFPIEDQEKRGWKLEINGEEYTGPISTLRMRNDRIARELRYGMYPAGYDGIQLTDSGVAILPVCFIKDPALSQHRYLFVGMVEEDRPNQGGKVLNIPRGMVDPGEDGGEAAIREFGEEVGLNVRPRVCRLEGYPLNMNSTFFDTSSTSLGVNIYSLEILQEELEPLQARTLLRNHTYQFKPGVITADPSSRAAEKIGECKFIHWRHAVQHGDGFTAAAIARFLMHVSSYVGIDF